MAGSFSQVIQNRFDNAERIGAAYGKIMEQEYMLIALKRMGILGPKRLQQLNDTLIEVRHDYCRLLHEDLSPEGNNDPEFSYTKGLMDREMKVVLGEENFVGYDVVMNVELYTEGVRQLQIRRALDSAVAEKMERLKRETEEENGLRALADKFNNEAL